MLLQRTAISIKKGLCNLDFLVEVFSQPLFSIDSIANDTALGTHLSLNPDQIVSTADFLPVSASVLASGWPKPT